MRSVFLRWLALLLLVLRAQGADSPAVPATPDKSAAAIVAGRNYLASQLDADLELLPEFPGHNVFWLYHDNYLAAKVLTNSHPEVAKRIRAAIAKQGVTRSGKIELLFGEAELPLHRYELRDVARPGGKVIRSEFTTGEIIPDVAEYADLLFFTAVAAKDAAKARTAYDAAMKMWDGSGFRDAVVKKSGKYATYKLGLALRAARRFADKSDTLTKIRVKLLQMQNSAGGWITDYKADGTRVGVANVETTCMAILGLEVGE